MNSYIAFYALLTGALFSVMGFLHTRDTYKWDTIEKRILIILGYFLAGFLIGGVGAYLRMQEFRFLGEAFQ